MKFLGFWQDKKKLVAVVEFHSHFAVLQFKNMASRGSVIAEKVQVISRHTDSFYEWRAPESEKRSGNST
jgi:hypothetical protein